MIVVLSKRALKFVHKQEKAIQKRIYNALRGLEEVPPIGDIKKIQGSREVFRLRVGSYRVLLFSAK